MNSFPNNLKRVRKASGMTQDVVAEQLHVTRQTVSGWETGRCQPDLQTLAELSRVLNADIHELIYGVKPGGYVRYQKRFMVIFALCAGIAGGVLLFCMFAMPWIKLWCNTYFKPWHFYLRFSLPQVGWFAAGVSLPAGYALVHQVSVSEKHRKKLLIAGFLSGLPGLLIGTDMLLTALIHSNPQYFTRLFYPWFITFSGQVVLLMATPFLTGIFLFLGFNREHPAE